MARSRTAASTNYSCSRGDPNCHGMQGSSPQRSLSDGLLLVLCIWPYSTILLQLVDRFAILSRESARLFSLLLASVRFGGPERRLPKFCRFRAEQQLARVDAGCLLNSRPG